MAAEEDNDGLRIVLKLYPGRDDLAIAELRRMKPRFRAERVRGLLHALLSGQSAEPSRGLSPVGEQKAGTVSDMPASDAQHVDESKSGKSSAGGADQGAAGDDFDLSQLDGLSIQTDFTSV